ncbi:MAG: hypothetical protein GX063_05440 [Firmicutes bacterium]|nr:hypothetical protein [Bacillota bacterium]
METARLPFEDEIVTEKGVVKNEKHSFTNWKWNMHRRLWITYPGKPQHFPRIYHRDHSSTAVQEILAGCGSIEDKVRWRSRVIHNVNRFSTENGWGLNVNGYSPEVIRRVHMLSTTFGEGIGPISWVFPLLWREVKGF